MSEPANETVMDALLEAWPEDEPTDEVETEVPAEPEPEPESEETDEEDSETEEVEEEDAGEEDTEEEPTEEAEDEEETDEAGEEEKEKAEPVSFSTNDPAILAYLARYDNDPAKALKAAVELQRVLTRQGTEKNAAIARVKELEAELERVTMFDSGPSFLSEEQREYVENAVASDNPLAWIQQATKAGEFDLARAIVEGWAPENPFPAMRAAQLIDRVESAYQPEPEEPVGFNQAELMQILVDNFPEMPRYEAQMVSALQNLGEQHPLVIGAKSPDPQEAARAIISLYEIARASTATVSSAREKVRRDGKRAAADARKAAVVSSASASPSGSQTPHKRTMIAPGLSLEDLDAEFAQHSQ